MTGAYTRAANSVHSMFVKEAMRKYGQRKYSSSDVTRERGKDEAKKKSRDNNGEWMPDDRTGIYYPKGQEKVIQDVPRRAAKDVHINWFSYDHHYNQM